MTEKLYANGVTVHAMVMTETLRRRASSDMRSKRPQE